MPHPVVATIKVPTLVQTFTQPYIHQLFAKLRGLEL